MEQTLNSASITQSSSRNQSILAGVITGQVAGLIMAVVVMIVFALFLGKSPLYPVQVIGSIIFGESALQGFHLGALLTGLVLHQAGPSLLWGLIFGIASNKLSIRSPGSALAIGLAVGVISMSGPYILIPFLMNIMQGTDLWNREVPMFWDWAAHLVFGLSFTLYPMIAGKLNERKG